MKAASLFILSAALGIAASVAWVIVALGLFFGVLNSAWTMVLYGVVLGYAAFFVGLKGVDQIAANRRKS